MHHWKPIYGAMIAGVALVALATISESAVAQQAPAVQPVVAPQTVVAPAVAPATAQRPVFRMRDLVTPQDRQAYRQAVRGARDEIARQQIREQWRVKLRERAVARGGVLWEPGMPMPGAKAGMKREAAKPAVLPPRAP